MAFSRSGLEDFLGESSWRRYIREFIEKMLQSRIWANESFRVPARARTKTRKNRDFGRPASPKTGGPQKGAKWSPKMGPVLAPKMEPFGGGNPMARKVMNSWVLVLLSLSRGSILGSFLDLFGAHFRLPFWSILGSILELFLGTLYSRRMDTCTRKEPTLKIRRSPSEVRRDCPPPSEPPPSLIKI